MHACSCRTQEDKSDSNYEKAKLQERVAAAGIIDPAKVVRVALENAISVASLLLLTEATMTEIASPEPKKQAEFAV